MTGGKLTAPMASMRSVACTCVGGGGTGVFMGGGGGPSVFTAPTASILCSLTVGITGVTLAPMASIRCSGGGIGIIIGGGAKGAPTASLRSSFCWLVIGGGGIAPIGGGGMLTAPAASLLSSFC